MKKKEKQFEEQDHPLKNTDKAFVKVGKDGEAVIPMEDEKNDDQKGDRITTLDHR